MYTYFIHKINSNKSFLTILLVFSFVFFATSAVYVIKKSGQVGTGNVAGILEISNLELKLSKYTSQKYISRGVLLYAQDITKQESLSLPEIARFYAYVSTTFFDIYNISNDLPSTLFAVKKVINTLYPKYEETTEKVMQTLNKNTTLGLIYDKEEAKLDTIIQWINTDGANTEFSTNLSGKTGWENTPINSLESPMAGTWKLWILDEKKINLELIEKPAETNNLFNEEIKNIKNTTKNMTVSQKNTSLYWLNNRGKEGIPGIWQNRLYDEVDKSRVSELLFAKIQKNLALSIADASIEIWKVKYKNWTPRLQFTNPEVVSIVPTPVNPRFVSEYAGIGAVASEILSFYLPNQKEIFIKDSYDARDSGKWGGISLDSDNLAGYNLGKNIATEIIKKLT
jgi:hypothetical protein